MTLNTPPFDPRSVANAILSLAEENGFEVTQLSLQKIVYFVHGRLLSERGVALVSGSFEAWPYGPVHPLLYQCFKDAGSGRITTKAKSKNVLNGQVKEVDEPADNTIRRFIRETAAHYLKLTPGRLVDLSHARRSAWDKATLRDDGTRKYGMQMSNDNIRELFKYHKVSIGDKPKVGEPDEESLPS